MSELELLGTIVRLQVQTSSLKCGEKPHRWYDPAPITPVRFLRLDDVGVTGVDDLGETVTDVHHRDHPQSRYRGENGISLGFTGHYRAMRNRHGERISDGIAGENILIQQDRVVQESELGKGVIIVTASGAEVALQSVVVAAPCVEFSKYSIGYANDQRPDRAVTEALQFLHNGMRGYYATLGSVGQPAQIGTGDQVYRVL